jgi:hypothetical protein
MKTQLIPTFIFLMLFAGFQIELQAQTSATVNYTIVVTEDMLAGVEDVEPRGFDLENNALYEGSEAASCLSVSLHTSHDIGSSNEFASFETEMSSADAPEVTDMFKLQISEHVEEMQSQLINDDGQYCVVMEYN